MVRGSSLLVDGAAEKSQQGTCYRQVVGYFERGI